MLFTKGYFLTTRGNIGPPSSISVTPSLSRTKKRVSRITGVNQFISAEIFSDCRQSKSVSF